MTWAACEDCGNSFWRADDEDWKRLCLPCFKRSRGYTKPSEGAARLREEIARLRSENEYLRFELVDLRHQATAAPVAAPTIPREMLRRLLHLAHPDRHSGSEAATIATQWLLEQREVRQ